MGIRRSCLQQEHYADSERCGDATTTTKRRSTWARAMTAPFGQQYNRARAQAVCRLGHGVSLQISDLSGERGVVGVVFALPRS